MSEEEEDKGFTKEENSKKTLVVLKIMEYLCYNPLHKLLLKTDIFPHISLKKISIFSKEGK